MARILLIEDEPLLARNIARALERAGFEVVYAASIGVAQDVIALGGNDLVIADITLGDGDGLDLLKESSHLLQNTPVIVMTGQDSLHNRARAECLPVAAFLSKPFALSRLVELVGGLLRTKTGEPQRKTGPSVVMYSHDTIGLGHMRRNSAIARELVMQVPDVSVLMLIGCPAGMVFEPHLGVDFVKLPSLSKLDRGVYQTSSLRIDAKTTRDMRSRIIEGVISSIQPSLFLVDHEPAGAMDELVSVLKLLRRQGNVRSVLGLRDILDDPERTQRLWRSNETDKLIADVYDQILLYGDNNFFPTAKVYGLEALMPGRVKECGVVTSAVPVRKQTTSRPPKRVIVSGGGGRDAYPLIEASILSLNELPNRKRPEMSVITGPLMDAELRVEVQRLGVMAGVEVLEHVNDLPALMAETDLLITMTGYNSINEALAIGCPIVTVPRLGPSAEQRLRAEALERLGLARYLRREDLSPKTIAKILLKTPPKPPSQVLNTDGVQNAATVLAAMCNKTQPSDKEPTLA